MKTIEKNSKKETWEIVLLTSQGLKTEIYIPLEKSISKFESEMIKKYGTFTTYSSKLI
jgi:hypothetical protein